MLRGAAIAMAANMRLAGSSYLDRLRLAPALLAVAVVAAMRKPPALLPRCARIFMLGGIGAATGLLLSLGPLVVSVVSMIVVTLASGALPGRQIRCCGGGDASRRRVALVEGCCTGGACRVHFRRIDQGCAVNGPARRSQPNPRETDPIHAR